MAATTTASKRAHFIPAKKDEGERKRVLTMKYGKQQIELIRKRLRVETWIVEALEVLCCQDDALVDIDLDTILDMETDAERRRWLQDQLKGCKAGGERVQKFINDALERLKTL